MVSQTTKHRMSVKSKRFYSQSQNMLQVTEQAQGTISSAEVHTAAPH